MFLLCSYRKRKEHYAFTLETSEKPLLDVLLHKRGRPTLQEIHEAERPQKSDGSLPFHRARGTLRESRNSHGASCEKDHRGNRGAHHRRKAPRSHGGRLA